MEQSSFNTFNGNKLVTFKLVSSLSKERFILLNQSETSITGNILLQFGMPFSLLSKQTSMFSIVKMKYFNKTQYYIKNNSQESLIYVENREMFIPIQPLTSYKLENLINTKIFVDSGNSGY